MPAAAGTSCSQGFAAGVRCASWRMAISVADVLFAKESL
jgi:hypothetical protein